MTHHDRQALAALATLILLQLIMLSALYAGIRPHPPIATPLFGIAPFLGASVSIALSAMIVQPLTNTVGRGLSMMAALMALVSFGPQKYLDAQFALIWPAVVLGQFAAFAIFVRALQASRHAGETRQRPAAPAGQV
ncbi:hypothetical protein FGK63_03315 [Ruegeria sediminis]|uniref:MFS transporter n=1 Tax=Ruegeria sediminis TaxID=2583820 RepID=A0ABY2X3Y4_9RHOB|nr:hypothetical protein [Ruegeria sediminis]TMV10106.1 hypothetical protein FGK63_03315 [Ruegeria sediminis]